MISDIGDGTYGIKKSLIERGITIEIDEYARK